jgi:hypothetical protein
VSGFSRPSHRTEKSVKLHLWNVPYSWEADEMSHNSIVKRRAISHWGEKEFNVTFNNLFEICKPKIEEWFNANHTLEDCLHLLEQQMEHKIRHATKYPSLEYVQCFLLAKLGRNSEAIDAIEKLKSSYIAFDKKWEPLFDQLVTIIKKTSP